MVEPSPLQVRHVFALVGAIGGWVAATCWGLPWELGLWLVICTAAMCFGLGIIQDRAHSAGRATRLGLGFMALAAGGLNGVVFLLGALVFEGDAEPGIAVVGGVFGVFHAIPFLPPLFWLDWAVESSFVTRPRTLAARRAKLEVAIALLTSVAFAWLFATHAVDRPLRAPALSLVTTLASLGGLVLLGVELVFLLRLRKTVRAWRDASPCSEEEIASRPPVDQPPVDLGVGEGWRRVVEEASLPYRDQARVVTAFQGDAEAAWSVAKQRTWVHGFVWLAALLSLASLGRGGLLRALF